MPNAVFLVYPDPTSELGQASFSLTVKPYPSGVSSGEGLRFANASRLKLFLDQLDEDQRLIARWNACVDAEEHFAIKSTFDEWRRLEAWAEKTIPKALA